MLYVCYMFSKHITCFKASVYRGLRSVMLYGYMFLRNSFFIQHKGTEIQSFYYFSVSLYLCVYQNTACGLRSPGLRGSKVPPPRVEGTGFKTLGDNP